MTLNNRLKKLESEMQQNEPKHYETVICEPSETLKQACQRLGLDVTPKDNFVRWVVKVV